MHEWALIRAIIAEVEEVVKKGYKVDEVTVYLGELQNVDKSVMEAYLNEAIPQIAPGAQVRYETEPARFRCRVCGREWGLDAVELDEATREAIHFVPEAVYSFVRCPFCGSRDYEITQGRGVRLALVTSRRQEETGETR
ncbi:[NiFe] hydrogenase nickel incorporation protein HypA [Pyrodictium delaneyi]|uniref:Hydrogenase maturation factor HypA n=1 Tax=Pyrodictium delaneyi TaxID=1273541 RepID=A0A0P0N2W7_9CREN|nr:hydrogenase nickel incorporation protein HypA [Pyrodictium delaneyi]ALL00850.1 [NiFe] hydrogenase nickel incorporation protein HypA [Pyrodictium delaneyi]